MGKTARKKNRNQGPSNDEQRSLHLAAFVRRNLYRFVIQEGMKAVDLMLAEDQEALCGARHAKGAPGDAVRWGAAEGRLVMGGQRVVVRKPRVRRNGKEVALPSWEEFASEDPLNERSLEQMVWVSQRAATSGRSRTCRTNSSPTARARAQRVDASLR